MKLFRNPVPAYGFHEGLVNFTHKSSSKPRDLCFYHPTPFYNHSFQAVEATKAQFSHDYSDHLALVWAYEGWKEAERDVVGYEYCWKNFLSAQSIKAIDALQREFYSSLKEYVLNFNARWM
ncbi:hypothetical protein LOK49_LG13G01398 [Camellia lanceoleosa]|uniref:Uncharacterized protein n=1 Tax=Camellia lanceoleosa TaxID=1840588 RepID=A0ACC0FMA3_9ERIC|nr:hypothetical protein LOK49_LG13G01398 [Camellia lanceoleosa]